MVNFIFRLKDGANSENQMNLDWKQTETFLTLYSELLGLVPSGYTLASGCPDRKAGGKPCVRTERPVGRRQEMIIASGNMESEPNLRSVWTTVDICLDIGRLFLDTICILSPMLPTSFLPYTRSLD